VIRQHGGESGNLIEQFGVSVGLDRIGDRAVIDQRCLITAAGRHMPVEAVITRVAFSPVEPAV
jgi:hypothetical protein